MTTALAEFAQAQDDAENFRLLRRLTEQEASSVTLLSDNQDWNALPNCVVIVNADWTDYEDRRFGGDTIGQAIAAAIAAMPVKELKP